MPASSTRTARCSTPAPPPTAAARPWAVSRPPPSVYQLAVDRRSAAANRILFFSSNGWDVQGAAAFGFRAIWINRALEPQEKLPGELAGMIGGIEEVPALLGVK